jgi:2-polyprenyl-6-methoxyphenol hydroxylase-like FAD-dependent oxidoreductase
MVCLTRKLATKCSTYGRPPAVLLGGPERCLALLLARRGVPVTLLEMHKDFDREFRGDTIHPSVMEVLDQIGLAGPLHQLRHSKVSGPTLQFANGLFRPFDLTRLRTHFRYQPFLHQACR